MEKFSSWEIFKEGLGGLFVKMKSIILSLLLLSSFAFAEPNAKLIVKNDYSFTIILLVKCGNWINDPQNKNSGYFEYEKTFKVKRGLSTIFVPKKYDSCQVYTAHKW